MSTVVRYIVRDYSGQSQRLLFSCTWVPEHLVIRGMPYRRLGAKGSYLPL